MNTLTTLIVIISLIHFGGVNPLFANFSGYFLGLCVSFTLNRRHTFKDQGDPRRSSLRFLAAAGFAYLLNLATILLTGDLLHLGVYFCQVLGNVMYTLSFFILCRTFVFRGANPRSRGVPRQPIVLSRPSQGDLIAIIKAWIVTGIVVWLIDTAGFNPLDDHQFARTILQGQPFGFYLNQALGRFYPLVAQEYVLIHTLIGHAEDLFYRVALLKLPLLGIALSIAIHRSGLEGWLGFLLWLLGICSFGVAGTLFRIHAGDLNAAILLLTYTALVLLDPAPMKDRIKGDSKAWLGLLLVVWASLYKESVTILVMMLSGSEVLRLYLMGDRRMLFRHLPVFAYAILYLAIYSLWAGHPSDANYATAHQTDRLTVLWKMCQSNPELPLLFLPLFGVRIATILRNPKLTLVYDVLLISGIGYVALFLFLGMWNQYYLFPGMALSLVGMAGLMARHPKALLTRIGSFAGILLLMDLAPAVYSEIENQHAIVRNHGQLIRFLETWAPVHCGTQEPPCTFILEGVKSDIHSEVLVSLNAFLQSSGARDPGVKADPSAPTQDIEDSPWERLHILAKRGDFVMVNPYRHGPFLPETPSMARIFGTDSHPAPPRWPLHEWIFRCANGFAACEGDRVAYGRYTNYVLYKKLRDTQAPDHEAPTTQLRSEIRVTGIPDAPPPGSSFEVSVSARNTGLNPWYPEARSLVTHPVYLLYRWIRADGSAAKTGTRQRLPEAILVGETLISPMRIASPSDPGSYRLEITLFQEGIQWIETPFSRDLKLQ